MAKIHFHGHATFSITLDDGTVLVVDPFFDDNPVADMGADDLERVDWILVTHGHADHFSDCLPLARRTGATVIASFEIANFLQEQGYEDVHPMHIGGGFDFPFGRVKMTPALHGGMVAGDESGRFSTFPAGFLLDLDGVRTYFAGDTALTMDMQLLEGRVDVALLPIGDNFTMGPEDAARAVRMIGPERVIPFHYGTWGYIEVDPADFVDQVGADAEVIVLDPGGEVSL